MHHRYLPVLRLTVFGLSVLGLSLSLAFRSTAEEAPKAKAAAQPEVKLKLTLPHKKATLSLEGKEFKGEGEERTVSFTLAKPGKNAVTFKIVWEPNSYTKITRVRKLEIEPGKSYEVDLRKRDEKTDPKDDIVVIYVPTPDEVVDKMAELAEIDKGDVVFDLGCGDGRMVCRAVGKHAAKRGA
jgi:hypothetical protein